MSVTSGWLVVMELAMRLQQHRLAGAGRGNDQSALALADGRQQVHHAAGVVVLDGFELEPLVGIERRQVVEEDLVARFLGRLEVDGVDLDEREVALAFLGRADLAGDGVAGAQIEAADLRGRDVDVVGAGQIVVLGRAQEAEAVGQAFEHAFGEDQAALFGLRLQDLEDQLLLAQAGGAGDAHVLGDLVELLDAHVLQLDQVEGGGAVLDALRGLLLAAMLAVQTAIERWPTGGRLGGAAGCRGLGGSAASPRPAAARRRRRGLHLGGAIRRRSELRPVSGWLRLRRALASAAARRGGRRGFGTGRRRRRARRSFGRSARSCDRLFGLLAAFRRLFRLFGCRIGGGVRGRRLSGGLFGGFFLRWVGSYRGCSVVVIACQISLTPRPVRAENGSGSTPSLRMARKPCSSSD